MILKLTNGENIELRSSFLFLKYLEGYKGGISQLEKDANNPNKQLTLISHVVSALVRSSKPDLVLTDDEALGLVRLEDIELVMEFLTESLSSMDEFAKKKK